MSGLCAANKLQHDLKEKAEIVVYEQWSEIGGTWAYTEETGVHSSMYRDLVTNLPEFCVNFPELRWGTVKMLQVRITHLFNCYILGTEIGLITNMALYTEKLSRTTLSIMRKLST